MRTSQVRVMGLVSSIALLLSGASSFRADGWAGNAINLATPISAECLVSQENPMGSAAALAHGGGMRVPERTGCMLRRHVKPELHVRQVGRL